MPHPKLIEPLYDNEDGLFGYYMASDAKTIEGKADKLMIWNLAGPKVIEVDIPEAKNVTVIDMLGGRSQAAVTDGKLHIEVGPLPVYVELP